MAVLKYIIAVIVGGIFGFGLYKFIGCSTGACPLTSNPYISVIIGMVLGLLVVSSI